MARITAAVGFGLLVGAAAVHDRAIAATEDPAALPTPVQTVDPWSPSDAGDDEVRALAGAYSGFGTMVDGGDGYPEFVVDSLADEGAGSVRDALAAATVAGGGRVVFAIAGDVVLARELRVPANTTLDGFSAPPPGVTLWGEQTGSRGGGVLEVYDGNVIVRGLRIRNAGNDGVQIAPKKGYAIAGIVVDHCSVSNSADGGIDVTGRDGLTVSDVTLSWNYVAGNGGVCAKGLCGGGALIKYGVTRVSVHGNFWDKNLRRNPSVNGALTDGGSLVDVRGNVVRQYVESGIQVTSGARGNVIGNAIEGTHPLSFYEAQVWAAENATPDAAAPVGTAPAPFDVTAPLAAVTRALVTGRAGAAPRDAVDEFYVHAVTTYDELKLVVVGPGVAPVLTLRAAPIPSGARRHKCSPHMKGLACGLDARGRTTDWAVPWGYRR